MKPFHGFLKLYISLGFPSSFLASYFGKKKNMSELLQLVQPKKNVQNRKFVTSQGRYQTTKDLRTRSALQDTKLGFMEEILRWDSAGETKLSKSGKIRGF